MPSVLWSRAGETDNQKPQHHIRKVQRPPNRTRGQSLSGVCSQATRKDFAGSSSGVAACAAVSPDKLKYMKKEENHAG